MFTAAVYWVIVASAPGNSPVVAFSDVARFSTKEACEAAIDEIDESIIRAGDAKNYIVCIEVK